MSTGRGEQVRQRAARIAVRIVTAALVWGAVLAACAPAEAAEISGIRIGIHRDKTRIVLDVDEKLAFRVVPTDAGAGLSIELPPARFSAGRVRLPPHSGIAAIRQGRGADGGARLDVSLVTPLVVQRSFLLPPGGGSGYRIVVDLAEPQGQAAPAAFEEDSAAALAAAILAPPPPAPRFPLPLPKPGAPGAPPLVVIDPGHGGHDSGAVGVSGRFEKDLVLAYAKELKRVLEGSGRYRAALTRNDDRFLRLRERTALATRREADLFISIHADSIGTVSLRGSSVYTLSETASDAEAAALAERENKAGVLHGMDLNAANAEVSTILIDLAQRDTMNQSKQFAQSVIHTLSPVSRMLSRSHRSAGFAVLKSPDVPAVLLELGYLSNPEEEKQLWSAAHRKTVCKALLEAVDRFFGAGDRVAQGT